MKLIKITRPYSMPLGILRAFIQDDNINTFCSMLTSLIERLGLSLFDEKSYQSIIKSNICTYHDVAAKYYRNIYEKVRVKDKNKKAKLKKTKVGNRAPGKPGGSPLFTTEENRFIREVCTPFWNDLEAITKDFPNQIYAQGFSAINARISASFQRRWKILTNLGTVTKKRLDLIKNIDKAKYTNWKKKDVTKDAVIALLSQRTSPGIDFRGEVLLMLNDVCSAKALIHTCFRSKYPDLNYSGAALALLIEIIDVYKDVKELKKETIDRELKVMVFDKNEETLATQVVRKVSEIVDLCAIVRSAGLTYKRYGRGKKEKISPDRIRELIIEREYQFLKTIQNHYLKISDSFREIKEIKMSDILNAYVMSCIGTDWHMDRPLAKQLGEYILFTLRPARHQVASARKINSELLTQLGKVITDLETYMK